MHSKAQEEAVSIFILISPQINLASGINATMRPAAGVLGVVAYPIHGAWKSGQKTWARKQESQQRSTRITDGVEDVRRSSLEEQGRVVAKFKAMTTPGILKQRRKGFTDAARTAMEESRFQTYDDTTASSFTATPFPRTVSSDVQDVFEHLNHPALPQDDNEDETFQRDLELAKQLSLAEQRGFERAMAERLDI